MASLPVIATNVSGVSELVMHNETGFLIPLNEVNYAVHYCMKLIVDGPLRHEMGARGRKFILEHFTIDKMIFQFEKVYDQLLYKKRPTL